MTANENPRVWLIGENNPYGQDPRYALYPEPTHSAGGRLCRMILGMTERDYLRSFERRNLLAQEKWSVRDARKAVRLLGPTIPLGDLTIMLGRKVFEACCNGPGSQVIEWRPFEIQQYVEGKKFLPLPHPSGLSRAWNEPGAYLRARRAVAELAPHLVPLLGPLENSKLTPGVLQG